MKEPLKPLIPLEDLGKVVVGIVRVPKDAVHQEMARPKPPRKGGRKKKA